MNYESIRTQKDLTDAILDVPDRHLTLQIETMVDIRMPLRRAWLRWGASILSECRDRDITFVGMCDGAGFRLQDAAVRTPFRLRGRTVSFQNIDFRRWPWAGNVVRLDNPNALYVAGCRAEDIGSPWSTAHGGTAVFGGDALRLTATSNVFRHCCWYARRHSHVFYMKGLSNAELWSNRFYMTGNPFCLSGASFTLGGNTFDSPALCPDPAEPDAYPRLVMAHGASDIFYDGNIVRGPWAGWTTGPDVAWHMGDGDESRLEPPNPNEFWRVENDDGFQEYRSRAAWLAATAKETI